MQGRAEPDQTTPRGKAYGLVLQITRTQQSAFLSARIAQRVVSGVTVSALPNSRLGMALVTGQVIPVVALGESTAGTAAELVLCELWESVTSSVDPAPADGPTESVAISGVKVLASGAFERLDASHVEFGGQSVEALDLAQLMDALE